jgi:hypothetical protein
MSGSGGTHTPSLTAPFGSREINYCVPASNYGCSYAYIDDVTFHTLSNVDSYCNGNTGGYINYAPSGTLTTSVETGSSYPISLEGGPSYDNVGFGVWIDYNNDGDFSDPDEFVFSSPFATTGVQSGTISIPNNASYIGERRMRIRSKEYSSIFSSEACTYFSYYYGESEDYTITITAQSAMVYVSSTTTQDNLDAASLGTQDLEILGIQIMTQGSLSPLSVTSLDVNSNGSTDFSSDVTNVKVYYFRHLFFLQHSYAFWIFSGSCYTHSGNQVLSAGNNYFWVTYDISASGTMGDFLDAECTAITMSGSGGTQVPAVTAPAGLQNN